MGWVGDNLSTIGSVASVVGLVLTLITLLLVKSLKQRLLDVRLQEIVAEQFAYLYGRLEGKQRLTEPQKREIKHLCTTVRIETPWYRWRVRQHVRSVERALQRGLSPDMMRAELQKLETVRQSAQ